MTGMKEMPGRFQPAGTTAVPHYGRAFFTVAELLLLFDPVLILPLGFVEPGLGVEDG